MTRDQLNLYFRFGTNRHTNRVLHSLSDYLSSIREGYQSIYYLNSKGKAYIGCDKVRKKGGHVKHVIMRNDMWAFHDYPKDWRNEVKVSDGSATVIVDAMFTDGWDRKHFLEIDHTQTMQENKNKIYRYKKLFENGLVEEKLGHFPTLVWLTTSEHRRKELKKACEGLPVVMVFTTNDIK
ncbi:replication-relaxation family protein [Sporosarcina highlanderae]|uniref:Replication-relaxation family protein n=1 Tax=Sporosarcina highlanderae TaxID=3035916 RepID=A0ABT8JWC8_9BACL|nr:replication-relaxation family protein [Sporosarcina highlanderae]MDN4609103.1 replication-relaxation family protein [Sporosarcina highlanderae]